MMDPDNKPNDPPEQPAPASDQQSISRSELLSRARTFLSTPHIRSQDNAAKHAFLVEKGLTQDEIDLSLREIPPSVPPRTYPQPPPSNLSNMLIGTARIFTWLTGTSAFVLFIYYRFFLPRITQTYNARLAIRAHQSGLMCRLNDSLTKFKEKQAECFADLPKPMVFKEDPAYAACHSLDDILACRRKANINDDDINNTSSISILRSAIEELSCSKDNMEGVTTQDLFSHMEAKLPWLKAEQGVECRNVLWKTLNNSPMFTSASSESSASPSNSDKCSSLTWTYVPPPISPPPSLMVALDTLQAALPRNAPALSLSKPDIVPLRPAQRTFQTLADFTGYITTQTYSFGLHPRAMNGTAATGNTEVDEIRREIRALKGLVLNRRSFLPNIGIRRPLSEPSALAGV